MTGGKSLFGTLTKEYNENALNCQVHFGNWTVHPLPSCSSVHKFVTIYDVTSSLTSSMDFTIFVIEGTLTRQTEEKRH